MSERFEDGILRRYLLGESPEAEQEAVEAAYLREPELFAQLQALEDELLDELVAGRLGPAQARVLERRLALHPDGPQRLRLARLLAARRARPAFRTPTWILAAALLLCAGLAAVLALRTRTLERELRETRAERLESQALGQALQEDLQRERRAPEALVEHAETRGPGAVLRLALAAGLTRGAHGAAELRLPPETGALQLWLALDDEPRPAYVAALQTPEGRTLWRQTGLLARRVQGRESVVFQVPAERLAPGDYVVLLQGSSAGGAPEAVGEYVFRVRR